MKLTLLVCALLVGTSLSASPVFAKRAPVTITRDHIINVNGYYLVDGTSQLCDDPLLHDPRSNSSYCGPVYYGCKDAVTLGADQSTTITYSWDRDARTVKPIKEVTTLPWSPHVAVNACAPNNIDYSMQPLDEIPSSAIRYQNTNHASLKTPVEMAQTGFNLFDLDINVAWNGAGQNQERLKSCDSYPDPATSTCLTVRLKAAIKNQRLTGTIKGSWQSESFFDPLCPLPYEMGCVPRDLWLPIDLSPTRATESEVNIVDARVETTVEGMVGGKCPCPTPN